MEAAALLDLICGPVGPLPEAHQRYRLVSHLATGGQAEVFRAVRLSGGISSAPLTVKVFRPGDDRPVADQLRSWDKGDAVLMDLNSRGVPGICRRADGFFGPPPHPPGQVPQGDPVPYQVLDYLHGVTIREYVAQRYGLGGQQGPRLDAVAALVTLAEVLRALHSPDDSRASPVLHMDVKPANVMVLTTGEVRLIDFTGARYYGGDHITTVAYTPGAGGPEASRGEVGPSYDVHGFGAVAYYLVTGEFPRHKDSPADGVAAPPWAALRRHPLLDDQPALREHLLAPVADRPEDRPRTTELVGWVQRLAALVTSAPCPDVGVEWGTGRWPSAAPGAAATAPPVLGTETGAFHRMETLERELVELRSSGTAAPPPGAWQRPPVPTAPVVGAGPTRAAPVSPGPAAAAASGPAGPQGRTQMTPTAVAGPARHGSPANAAPAGGFRQPGAASSGMSHADAASPSAALATQVTPRIPAERGVRGVASVPQHRPDPTLDNVRSDWGDKPLLPPGPPRPPDLGVVLQRGSKITGAAVTFAFVCWGIWSVASGKDGLIGRFMVFLLVLAIGLGVFVLSRLLGRVVWERVLRRIRRSARGAHLLTGIYLVAAGLGFLQQTPWVMSVWGWIWDLL